MLKKILAGSCLIAVAQLVLTASPAYAGFQWMAQPDATPSYQAAPSYATVAPAASAAPEIVSPVIISGAADETPRYAPAATAAPTPLASDASSLVLSTAPAAPAKPAKEAMDLSSATLTIPASASNEAVRGFGSQIPLALALRQILPVGYHFSIDQNIEVDTPVSYKGGKPWRDTIKDMLAPVGLTMSEQGPTVTISRAAAPAMSAPAPVAMSAAPALQPAPSALPPKPLAPQTLGTLSNSYVSELPGVNVGSGSGWSAQRGDSLHKVLTEWARRAGVELQWRSEYDYPMEASASFSGDFEDAVRGVLAGFESARPQPVAELHSNPSAGQKILVVQARGNNYSN